MKMISAITLEFSLGRQPSSASNVDRSVAQRRPVESVTVTVMTFTARAVEPLVFVADVSTTVDCTVYVCPSGLAGVVDTE
jgi:hypothetical protein